MTNPPIPPTVVETMARAISDVVWGPAAYRDSYLAQAQAALSAALATGSVVICSPELKALMEASMRFDRDTSTWRDNVAQAALAYGRSCASAV